MIFDGKTFAREIESQVCSKGRILVKPPKIVSILVGTNPASEIYTRLKKSAAERCGIEFLIERLDVRGQMPELKKYIEKVGVRKDVTGVMVQLPIPGLQGQALQDVLAAIPLTKDVDGLRWEESGVMPATARAILSILDKIQQSTTYDLQSMTYVVVGANGVVGRSLVHYLRERGVKVVSVGRNDPTRSVLAGDVVISCVGEEGIVTENMVKPGAIVVDVGAPKGDMTSEVYQKASVAVAVPGGVGPVTIACLMENAVSMI